MPLEKKSNKRWIGFSELHKKIAFFCILVFLVIAVIDILISVQHEDTASFKQLSQWNKEGLNLKLFINLSPKNLTDSHFPDILEKYKNIYNINPSDICFEITESTKLEKLASAKDVLEKIKALNFKIAIDDFGTGYSTLSYIKDFPVDIVKLDRSFIQNIEKQVEDRLFLKFISDISLALNKDIIIEGVETPAQEQIVMEHQIKYAQGFYYSNAKKANDLEEVFKKYGLTNKVIK